LSYPLQIRR